MPIPSNARHDTLAWLRLSLIPGVGDHARRKLLFAFRSPQGALAAPVEALATVVGPKLAKALAAGPGAERVDRAMAWLEADDCHLVALGDPAYPALLLETFDPPAILYVRGRLELLGQPAVAIVGSRVPSALGQRDAEAMALALSEAGFTIVSGLALGIDTAAHRGGLAGGSGTVAVVGTGADRIYPARNRELALRIAAEGAVVSEFPLGTPPERHNFPRRNRVLSGLSRGVLVVEAAMDSGSLITARIAADQNRDVFAMPGSIHSPTAKGCHWLIRQGAQLVETAGDLLQGLGYEGEWVPKPMNARPLPDVLLDAMDFEPTSIDQLASRTGVAAAAIAARLTELEIDGRIASAPGGRFQRLDAV